MSQITPLNQCPWQAMYLRQYAEKHHIDHIIELQLISDALCSDECKVTSEHTVEMIADFFNQPDNNFQILSASDNSRKGALVKKFRESGNLQGTPSKPITLKDLELLSTIHKKFEELNFPNDFSVTFVKKLSDIINSLKATIKQARKTLIKT